MNRWLILVALLPVALMLGCETTAPQDAAPPFYITDGEARQLIHDYDVYH